MTLRKKECANRGRIRPSGTTDGPRPGSSVAVEASRSARIGAELALSPGERLSLALELSDLAEGLAAAGRAAQGRAKHGSPRT